MSKYEVVGFVHQISVLVNCHSWPLYKNLVHNGLQDVCVVKKIYSVFTVTVFPCMNVNYVENLITEITQRMKNSVNTVELKKKKSTIEVYYEQRPLF